MEYKLEEKELKIKIYSIAYKTIQDFFNEYIPSSKIQHLLIQNKWIKIDDKSVKREDEIKGDVLSINIYPYDKENKKLDYKIDVVYEDEFIIVVNKAKDLLVHSDGNSEITLTDYVKSYYTDRTYIDVTPIHRLDKETSGLIVFSKSKIFQPLFDKLLEEKQIRRHYLAFTNGEFKQDSKTIDLPIGRDRHNPNKRIIYMNGQPAVTKLIKIAIKKDISIIRCILGTGRTHQIRVHLANENLPILNDSLYGVKSNKIIRMGLIADELEFYHPIKEEMIELQIPLPNDLSKLYEEVTR